MAELLQRVLYMCGCYAVIGLLAVPLLILAVISMLYLVADLRFRFWKRRGSF